METLNITISYGTSSWTLEDIEWDPQTEELAEVINELAEGWFEEIGSSIPNFDWDLYSVETSVDNLVD